jgi:hypothetical protein
MSKLHKLCKNVDILNQADCIYNIQLTIRPGLDCYSFKYQRNLKRKDDIDS